MKGKCECVVSFPEKLDFKLIYIRFEMIQFILHTNNNIIIKVFICVEYSFDNNYT
jgi:hypothetical protein